MSFKKFIMSSKVIKIGIISLAAMSVSAAPITILAKKNNEKSAQLKTIKKKNDDKIKKTQVEVRKLKDGSKRLKI